MKEFAASILKKLLAPAASSFPPGFDPLVVGISIVKGWTSDQARFGIKAPGQVYWPCPRCGVTGFFSYFPPIVTTHEYDSSIPEGQGVAVPGRWDCKWCGWYWSEQFGFRETVPDKVRGVWMFKEDATDPNQPTPKQLYERQLLP